MIFGSPGRTRMRGEGAVHFPTLLPPKPRITINSENSKIRLP